MEQYLKDFRILKRALLNSREKKKKYDDAVINLERQVEKLRKKITSPFSSCFNYEDIEYDGLFRKIKLTEEALKLLKEIDDLML